MCCFAGCWLALVRQPGFAFGSINVEGSDKVTAKDILQISGVQEPVNLFVISPWQVQKALTHDVRFEKADVSYSWPGVMRVKITERRPAVYLACSYNGYAKVDYTGVVMEVSDGIKDANAPVLSGIVTGNIYFGDRIGEKQVLLILEFLMFSRAESILQDFIPITVVFSGSSRDFNVGMIFMPVLIPPSRRRVRSLYKASRPG